MDISNHRNLIRDLGLKPCPLCNNTIYIDSITLENNGIHEMTLHCEKCLTEYKIQTTEYMYDNLRMVNAENPIDIWNNRGDKNG